MRGGVFYRGRWPTERSAGCLNQISSKGPMSTGAFWRTMVVVSGLRLPLTNAEERDTIGRLG